MDPSGSPNYNNNLNLVNCDGELCVCCVQNECINDISLCELNEPSTQSNILIIILSSIFGTILLIVIIVLFQFLFNRHQRNKPSNNQFQNSKKNNGEEDDNNNLSYVVEGMQIDRIPLSQVGKMYDQNKNVLYSSLNNMYKQNHSEVEDLEKSNLDKLPGEILISTEYDNLRVNDNGQCILEDKNFKNIYTNEPNFEAMGKTKTPVDGQDPVIERLDERNEKSSKKNSVKFSSNLGKINNGIMSQLTAVKSILRNSGSNYPRDKMDKGSCQTIPSLRNTDSPLKKKVKKDLNVKISKFDKKDDDKTLNINEKRNRAAYEDNVIATSFNETAYDLNEEKKADDVEKSFDFDDMDEEGNNEIALVKKFKDYSEDYSSYEEDDEEENKDVVNINNNNNNNINTNKTNNCKNLLKPSLQPKILAEDPIQKFVKTGNMNIELELPGKNLPPDDKFCKPSHI